MNKAIGKAAFSMIELKAPLNFVHCGKHFHTVRPLNAFPKMLS